MHGTQKILNRKLVAVVFDPDFGSRVETIMEEMPVWIVTSYINNQIVDRARKSHSDTVDITVFFCRPNESKKNYFARVLYSLDEHEGKTSKLDGYDELLIYGESEVEIDKQVLNELGLENIEKTSFGWRAGRLEINEYKRVAIFE